MLDKLPSPFWAVILAGMGAGLALASLFHPTPENIALAVLGVGSNLVSGALGAFAGHAQASAQKADVTTPDARVTIGSDDQK
jgi:hypothetical protein